MSVYCPRFKISSRWTVNKDCISLYLEERLKLKNFLKEHYQRVNLTTDSWTSIQRLNYICISAHFIDDEWKLYKRILSFVPMSSHKGEYITKAMEDFLLEWGLKSVFLSLLIMPQAMKQLCLFLKNCYIRVQVVLELNMYMSSVLHIF